MKNSVLVLIAVFFMGCLLTMHSCGVTAKLDDPAGAAKSISEIERERREAREAEESKAAKPAEEADTREFSEIVPPFPESKIEFEDNIGYEEWFHFVDEETVRPIAGVIRRQQFFIPKGRSPLKIIRYYQSKLQEHGGEIFFHSREPKSLSVDGENITHYFGQQKQTRTPAGNLILLNMDEFLSAKVNVDGKDIYVVVATRAADGIWAGRYEVVTVVDEPMTW